MSQPPFRVRSPEEQLVTELRARIRRGEYGEAMPGLRRLMADFDVSRNVMEAVIGELLRSDDLRARGATRAMQPVARRASAKDGEGTLFVHDRDLDTTAWDAKLLARAMMAQLPQPVVALRVPGNTPKTDRAVRAILAMPQRRVLLMDHPGAVAGALMEKGKIVVVLGSMQTTNPVHSTIFVSHEVLVRTALQKAFEAGHKRVSFPLWRRRLGVAETMRGWIAEEYARAGLRHVPAFDAPIIDDASPAAFHAALMELTARTPPTAVIASDYFQWLATITVLGRARLRTPEDVSTICLISAVEWEAATPTPAHFVHPVQQLVAETQKLFAEGARGAPPRTVSLKATWVPGDSLRPPKA